MEILLSYGPVNQYLTKKIGEAILGFSIHFMLCGTANSLLLGHKLISFASSAAIVAITTPHILEHVYSG